MKTTRYLSFLWALLLFACGSDERRIAGQDEALSAEMGERLEPLNELNIPFRSISSGPGYQEFLATLNDAGEVREFLSSKDWFVEAADVDLLQKMLDSRMSVEVSIGSVGKYVWKGSGSKQTLYLVEPSEPQKPVVILLVSQAIGP